MRKLLIFLIMLATPVMGVNPNEMLSDPVLEERAQFLDTQLRCMQCVSEVIASSNAGWAQDARLLVRELLVEGKSDKEILTFFVEIYGEKVLMRPRLRSLNWVLWLTGPLLIVIGGFFVLRFVRRKQPNSVVGELSAAEQSRLDELLQK